MIVGGRRPKVVELSLPVVQPCGVLLAMEGLEVLSVAPAHAENPWAWAYQVGKQEISIEWTDPLVRELVADADVVVTGFQSDELDSIGLSHDVMRRRNPHLIIASILPFGASEPDAKAPASEGVVFSRGGVMFISGRPGHPPAQAPAHQSWVVAGIHAALAIVASLAGQERDPKPETIEVSALEVWAAQENTITNYLGPGRFARRQGSQHRSALPGRIFPTADGFCHLFVSREESAWHRFLEWIGHPIELSDPSLAEITHRWRNFALVDSFTAATLSRMSTGDAVASAQALHIPCVPVNTPESYLRDIGSSGPDPTVTYPYRDGSVRGVAPPIPPSPQFGRRTLIDRPNGLDRSHYSAPSQTGMGGPLAGVRVTAFTHVAAGPYATMQLAYLGAEVIKVESRSRVDYWRFRDHNTDPERSRPFADLNKNTRSVTLDLKNTEGRELAIRLASDSDILVCNFSSGVMARLGLDYDNLARENPGLVYVMMTGLGTTGPRREWVTFGPSLMSFVGMTAEWTDRHSDVPVGSQSSYPDYLSGVYAALVATSALLEYRHSGTGRYIDLSEAAVTAWAMAPVFAALLNDDRKASAPESPLFSGCYRCAPDDDAWCTIEAVTQTQLEALRRLIGHPRDDSDQVVLEEAIAKWCRTRTSHEAAALLRDRGIPAGPVSTGEDLAGDPHLRARDFFWEGDHQVLGRLRLPGNPVRLSCRQVPIWRAGPLLGEDNAYVLGELLGLDEQTQKALAERGAVA